MIDDPARLGLASVGVTLIERDGVTHVIDIVGREHYPHAVEAVIDSSVERNLSLCALRACMTSR